MALAKLDLRDVVLDPDGLLNAGGFIYTYAAGGTTPQATYSDADGTENANPIELDASGQAHIWLTVDVAYRFDYATPDAVVFYSDDDITVGGGGSTAGSNFLDTVMTYPGGPPDAGEWLGGERFGHAFTLAANCVGSYGKAPLTNPAADFAVDIKKNGTTCATATCGTLGVWAFTTVAGAVISFAVGDYIDFYGPVVADTNMADFGLTLVGALS